MLFSFVPAAIVFSPVTVLMSKWDSCTYTASAVRKCTLIRQNFHQNRTRRNRSSSMGGRILLSNTIRKMC